MDTGNQAPFSDELAYPDERPKPRRRWGKITLVTASVILGVMAVSAGLWVGDQWLRSREYGQWLTSTEQAEDVLNQAMVDWGATMAKYEKSYDTEPGFTGAWQRFAQTAKDASVDLAVSRSEMARMTFAPWHSSIDQAREDYLEHIDAWMDQYDDYIAKGLDPDHTFDNEAVINRTFAVAKLSSRQAIPTLFTEDYLARQEAEFEN